MPAGRPGCRRQAGICRSGLCLGAGSPSSPGEDVGAGAGVWAQCGWVETQAGGLYHKIQIYGDGDTQLEGQLSAGWT